MNNNSSLRMPVKGKPFAHQQDAYTFACSLFGLTGAKASSTGCALLMEMGCGKSLVALAIMGALMIAGLIHRALIVCPLSITSMWEEEMAKFADFPYSITILTGSAQRKRAQLESLPRSEFQIVICNYESVWRLETELAKFDAEMIIADEGHRLKDGTTKQSKAMHRLGDSARFRLLLTGTAITNREIDIFSEYRFTAPEVFGKSFYAFRGRYFYMGGYGGYVPILKKEMRQEFLEKLHSVAYRVRKEDCLDLPPITEEVRTVDLEPKAMRLYNEIVDEWAAELSDGAEVFASNVLTRILRLSQITGGHLTDDSMVDHVVSTAKIEALSSIVDTMQAEDRKLVVMARFTAELDDIENLLRKKKIGYAVIRGGIKDREEQVRKFQTDDRCRVFIGQIQTAGTGLTLTAASTMVFFSLSYSMSDFDQAKARIHRVSQTENCHYIYLCCRDTIDRRVLRSLRKKIDLAKLIIDDFRAGDNPFK